MTTTFKTKDRREWQTVILLGLVASLIIGYIFLVNRVVFHAVGKRDAGREIAVLQNEMIDLEARALTLGNRVTIELAYSLGFVDSGTNVSYTAAPGTTGLLVSSRNYDRR